MGFISDLFEKRYRTSPGTSVSKPEQWFLDFIGAAPTSAGVDVNEWTALNSSAVFACIRILSETVASIPLHLYERTGDGKERAEQHRLYSVLHDMANPEMSAFTFRETLQGHLGSWGNAYAEIQRNQRNEVTALWPLLPDRTWPERIEGTRELVYNTTIAGRAFRLPKERVLHISFFGYDGMVGYSPIRLGRESIVLAQATEQYGSKFFSNDTRPNGFLKHPGKLSQNAKENLRKQFEDRHQGLDNSHRLAVLEEGVDFQSVGIPPEDAQMLQTRKFQIAEIARWYRMQLHKLAEMDSATFSNIEQQAIEFVQDTIYPWVSRWEAAIKTQLLSRQERNRYFPEFLMEGLLRGDTQSRFNAYAIARQWGWMSANDVRERENMNKLPGEQGDVYLSPMNMVPANEYVNYTGQQRQDPTQLEQRNEKRNSTSKHNKALNYRRIFKDAAERLIKSETKDIRRGIKKLNERDVQDFNAWLEQYYDEAPDRIKRTMMPAMLSYAEAIQEEAAEEVGAEKGMSPELEKYMERHAEFFATDHIRSSKGQIEALVREAVDKGENPADLIEDRLKEWEEKRPGKISVDETTEVAGVVSKFVYAAAGVTTLRWVNASGDPCPFCQEMDGKVVGIDQPFVGREEKLTAEDEDTGMRVRKPAFTPPIHNSCQCQIEPGN